MNQVRVDPLTGLKVIIAAARAGRPGGHFDLDEGAPIDTERDPFFPGHEDRTPPELHAVRPNGGGPDTPGWSVRVVPNLYPALAPGGEEPEAEAEPDLFTAQRASGAHEVIVNAPDAVHSLGDLEPEQVAAAMEVWRDRMRAHADAACVHVLVNEGRDGGASLPHTHAQLYALDFVPAAVARERERFGAYATRTMGGNLLGRPRAGGGAPARARGRGRRRGGAVRPVRVAAAVPADDRAAPPARPVRGRGAARRRAGARRAHAAAPPARRDAAAEPVGPDRAARRRPLLLADRHRAAPGAPRRASSWAPGVHLCVVAPEQAAAELRAG